MQTALFEELCVFVFCMASCFRALDYLCRASYKLKSLQILLAIIICVFHSMHAFLSNPECHFKIQSLLPRELEKKLVWYIQTK